MSIICLEGASAVGKTTTAIEIARKTNTYIIPEVNLLYERPKKETKTWYLERQVERWQIAQEKSKEYDTVILDGDLFQPLSYNWCFDFNLFNQSLDFLYEFYLREIGAGRIGFPDKYFYLHTNQENLRDRKENDRTRKRGNFEKHLKIIEPHQRYYMALNLFSPGYVKEMEAKSIDENANVIIGHLPSSTLSGDLEKLLDNIVSWLRENKA
ncbi:chloramphenicol acetyltransferase [Cytobacillus sp. FJAT-54145]|uniref:Chloramphenicol acetyltransferase n=1 Tax=Cytobacillus spartinae TaxID=3299023 RepID=A0ABW6KB87_9BACI